MSNFPDGFALLRAGPADLVAFGELSRRTFVDTYAPFQTEERMARHVADRLNDTRLAEQLADPARTTLGVLHEDAWVAYALLRGEPAPPEIAAVRPVEVERFYVDKAWHGRGLAAPLMEAALDTARRAGHDVAWLGVWTLNPRAVRFYEKLGFRIVGQHKYLFDDVPEDDYLMAQGL